MASNGDFLKEKFVNFVRYFEKHTGISSLERFGVEVEELSALAISGILQETVYEMRIEISQRDKEAIIAHCPDEFLAEVLDLNTVHGGDSEMEEKMWKYLDCFVAVLDDIILNPE